MLVKKFCAGTGPKARMYMLLVFFLSLFLPSCYYYEYLPRIIDRVQYNPSLAGATVVQRFEFTGALAFIGSYIYYFMDNHYDLAVHGDSVYLWVNRQIMIFDKDTMEHKRNVVLRFFDLERPEVYGGFLNLGSLVVTDNFSLMLCTGKWASPPLSGYESIQPHVLSIDLETGNLEVLDPQITFGIELGTNAIMGFDRENGLLWVRQGGFGESVFQFFSYDDETGAFTQQGTKNGFAVGSINQYHAQRVALHGSTAWSGYIGNIWDARRMEKRDIDNPEVLLRFIDILSLGLTREILNIPIRFAYDAPYIYLLVTDYTSDGYYRAAMLKLLPYEPSE